MGALRENPKTVFPVMFAVNTWPNARNTDCVHKARDARHDHENHDVRFRLLGFRYY